MAAGGGVGVTVTSLVDMKLRKATLLQTLAGEPVDGK
jgi:hypothetical protein